MKAKSIRLLVLHGPNLNLLGEREPQVYGSMTLAQLDSKLKKEGKRLGAIVKCMQSNHEGRLIDILHRYRSWADGVVFNPGAYTHYSYALRDAVAAIALPTIEVHLSDIHAREDFRKISVIAPVCVQQISGLGYKSYVEALEILVQRKKNGGQ